MTIFYEFMLLELDTQLWEMRAGTKDTCCHQSLVKYYMIVFILDANQFIRKYLTPLLLK